MSLDSRRRDPAERPLAAAEERPDELGHEAPGSGTRPRRPPSPPARGGCCRSRTSRRPRPGTRAWPARAAPSIRSRARRIPWGAPRADGARVRERQTGRHVQPFSSSCADVLIGHEVEAPRAASAGSTSAAFPTSPTDSALLARTASTQPSASSGRGGRAVEIARRQAPLHALGIDLDGEADPFVHRDRERLRPAHAAEPRRERPASSQRSLKRCRAASANVS